MASSELNLGELEQIVLLAVLRVGAEAYAAPILDEIARTARRLVARGALYTVLDRLETKGLVRSRTGDPNPERGGRPRRYYLVSAAGRRALAASRRTLLELWRGVDSLLSES